MSNYRALRVGTTVGNVTQITDCAISPEHYAWACLLSEFYQRYVTTELAKSMRETKEWVAAQTLSRLFP
jgi:hypothetical protein